MKTFVSLALVLWAIVCFGQSFSFESTQHGQTWWKNAEMQPHYQTVFDDTIGCTIGTTTKTMTTDWFRLTAYGETIFRLSYTLDTLGNDAGTNNQTVDTTSFHYYFETLLDTAEDDFPMRQRDGSDVVIAPADSLQKIQPFSYVDKLNIYEGRWIRFTFYCADTCSLRAYLGGHY